MFTVYSLHIWTSLNCIYLSRENPERMSKFSITTLVIIILLSSCELPKKKSDETVNEDVQEQSSSVGKDLNYSLKTIKKSTGDCENSGCAKVKVVYPKYEGSQGKFVNGRIEQKVAEVLLDFVPKGGNADSPGGAVDAILKDFENVQKEFGDLSEQWEINVSIDVAYMKEDLITIVINTESYTGGAHGSNTTHYINYDWNKRKELKVSDVVKDQEKLSAVAEQYFRKANNIKSNESLGDKGFYFDSGFELNDNIGYTSEGLNIYFNSYEIAPYAMGPTSIIIPYSEVKDLLKY